MQHHMVPQRGPDLTDSGNEGTPRGRLFTRVESSLEVRNFLEESDSATIVDLPSVQESETPNDSTLVVSKDGQFQEILKGFKLTAASPPIRRPVNTNITSNEVPSAYTPRPAQSPTFASSSETTANNPYAFLKSFDTIFLIDDYGSIAGRSWREVGKALDTITPICTKRNADGIDIYFLNYPASSVFNTALSSPITDALRDFKTKLTACDRKFPNNIERSNCADLYTWKPFESLLSRFLKGQSNYWRDGFFTRVFTASALSLLVKPVAAQNPRNNNPELTNGRDEPRWTEWIIGGLLVGLCVLVLASICKNPGNAVSQRLKSLSAPAMTFSSVAFLLFRNGDPVEAKMAWAPFFVWFLSVPAYVRFQQEHVTHFQLYMLTSAMLTGVLMCTIGIFQQESLVGGVVTVLPACAAFSVFACGVAFRARVQCSFSPA